jgi:hypothetical protein
MKHIKTFNEVANENYNNEVFDTKMSGMGLLESADAKKLTPEEMAEFLGKVWEKNKEFLIEALTGFEDKIPLVLLSAMKKKCTAVFNWVKGQRAEDKQWKTDAAAEMGDLGFD